MTDAAREREQSSSALLAESDRLLQQLLVAAARLDDFVIELRREARRRAEGKT